MFGEKYTTKSWVDAWGFSADAGLCYNATSNPDFAAHLFDTMPIIIRPIGSIKRFIAPDTVLEDTHSVGDAIEQLSLPEEIGLVMLVNERIANWNTPLADGDTLQLIPTISGG